MALTKDPSTRLHLIESTKKARNRFDLRLDRSPASPTPIHKSGWSLLDSDPNQAAREGSNVRTVNPVANPCNFELLSPGSMAPTKDASTQLNSMESTKEARNHFDLRLD